jgi:hypothetical protein
MGPHYKFISGVLSALHYSSAYKARHRPGDLVWDTIDDILPRSAYLDCWVGWWIGFAD